MDRFHQSLLGEVRVTSQGDANAHNYLNPLAEQHVYWQEQARNASNFQHKRASKEQLKSMSKQLVMKFMLQLHKPPMCLERKCGKECVLSEIKQSNLVLLVELCCWVRWIVSQATHWKTGDEVC